MNVCTSDEFSWNQPVRSWRSELCSQLTSAAFAAWNHHPTAAWISLKPSQSAQSEIKYPRFSIYSSHSRKDEDIRPMSSSLLKDAKSQYAGIQLTRSTSTLAAVDSVRHSLLYTYSCLQQVRSQYEYQTFVLEFLPECPWRVSRLYNWIEKYRIVSLEGPVSLRCCVASKAICWAADLKRAWCGKHVTAEAS